MALDPRILPTYFNTFLKITRTLQSQFSSTLSIVLDYMSFIRNQLRELIIVLLTKDRFKGRHNAVDNTALRPLLGALMI